MRCVICGEKFMADYPRHTAKTCSIGCSVELEKKREHKRDRREYSRLRHQQNKEKLCAASRLYYKLNREECIKRTRKWRKKNAAKISPKAVIRVTEWKKNNPDKVKINAARYRKRHSQEIRAWERRYYKYGPQNPKGTISWLKKNAAQLRLARRLLRKPSLVAKLLQTEISALGLTLPT